MKTRVILIAIGVLVAIFILASCEEESLNKSTSDYFIFGHFYGECGGEQCIEIYKLESGQLYEDINDNYPDFQNAYAGDYLAISSEKFEVVKDIVDAFPQQLFEETNLVIGQPDAGDWGGLYIEYNYNGVNRFWLIDLKTSNTPDYLHDFVDEVQSKIALINQ